jgi:predicted esterase
MYFVRAIFSARWLAPALLAFALAGCDETDGASDGGAGGSDTSPGGGDIGGSSHGGAGGASAGAGGTSTGSGGDGGGTGGTSGGGGSAPSTGVDPSNGSGGTIGPGQTGSSPLGAIIRIPTSYDPALRASPVVWLFNEELPQWSAIADASGIVLVDLDEYNDIDAIVAKLNETAPLLDAGYNVDRARYYWAGWSAGGNIVVILGSQNQDTLAGTMVFPGTGGSIAQPHMSSNQGHKLRLFYACGDQDPNYGWQVVENEANVWGGLGYTTHFVRVDGAAHYIDEPTYGVRADAWSWIEGFNLQN